MIARTYGSLRRVTRNGEPRWSIDALEPHVATRLKQLFPRLRRAAGVPFEFPDDMAHAVDLEWFTQRYPLEISEADRDALVNGRLRFAAHQAELERILSADYEKPAFAGLQDGAVVRDYQAQVVDILRRTGGVLCGDDVGLGKTYTAAAACLDRSAWPAVVVCQAHLQHQWCEVLERFTTLRVHRIKGTRPYTLPHAEVYVFRYTQLAGWADFFAQLRPGLVAFDEIQELRTGAKSAKGQAAWRLSQAASERLGLTATPIYGYGNEIFDIMEYVRPGVLGSREEFIREYGFGKGMSDLKALGTYLREQHAFIRRTKRDVGQELPAVNRIVETIDHDRQEVASIEAMARELATRSRTGSFMERGQALRELDMLVRHNTGVAKSTYVADFVRMLVEGGEPVLLAGWHRDVYDTWLARLEDLNPLMYTGSETTAAKDRAAQAFIAGESNLMIISLRSGAGLDGLQHRCSTLVVGELDWSQEVHKQLIGRLDREGQADPVTAFFLVTGEGSDPPMIEINGLKASQAAQVVDPALGLQAAFTDESRLKQLAARYLGKRRAMAEAAS